MKMTTNRAVKPLIHGIGVALLTLVASHSALAQSSTQSSKAAWVPSHFVFLDVGPGDRSSKTPDEMLEMCGLSAEDICNRALSVLQVV